MYNPTKAVWVTEVTGIYRFTCSKSKNGVGSHRALLLWVRVVRFYFIPCADLAFFMQEIFHNLGVCYMYLKHFNKVMSVGSKEASQKFQSLIA